jgi:hypothetical protein
MSRRWAVVACLYYGYWRYSGLNADFYDLLVYKDAVVIHDPDAAFTKLALMVDKIDHISTHSLRRNVNLNPNA